MIDSTLLANVEREVAASFLMDVGDGDITALLIDQSVDASARVIARERCVVCGIPWFSAVFNLVDPDVQLKWLVQEGDEVVANQPLVELAGNARSLVTGEREALNWLQTLSGTATTVARYVALLHGTNVSLLDTRKTIPGLRIAQKYAVTIGGGKNHRMGLYDAFLIKENHIMSCGSIEAAIKMARTIAPQKLIEVEVESLDELSQALSVKADIVMLDNFSIQSMKQAVDICQGRAKLEVSGNVTDDQVKVIAATGIDYISVGALTKHVQAVDLSMRFQYSS